MNYLDEYETKLLSGWEDVYVKGVLTFWLMLALRQGPKHMAQMKLFLKKHSLSVDPDDQSIYRSLRRICDAELIDFTNVPSENGPKLKVYKLTETGRRVFAEFSKRNIAIFNTPYLRKLL